MDVAGILTTKLQCPVLGTDLITRPFLVERLNKSLHLPLTLISAPAGYGKSTLIGQWLLENSVTSAWLSLDTNDDDPITFLIYVAYSINTVIADQCKNTLAALEASPTPKLDILLNFLMNDLNELDENLVLVLDDYHYIRDERIHDLMIRFLKYLPQRFHLIVITRHDPPWHLVEMRMRNQIAEVRLNDLAFSDSEKQLFFNTLGIPLTPDQITQLTTNLEGWAGGLRLLSLAMRANLSNDNQLVQQEISRKPSDAFTLFLEILERQPPDLRQLLLKISILDRFCAPLIDALIESHQSQSDMTGAKTIKWLKRSELFLISLDNQSHWYRFHHLFQLSLQELLVKEISSEAISGLHNRAAQWLENEGFVDAAIYHAIEAGNEHLAINMVSKHRHDAINQEDWHQIERWLSKFSASHIQSEPQLLMTKALLEDSRYWYTTVDLPTITIPKGLDGIEQTIFEAERAGLLAAQANQRSDYTQGAELSLWALDNLPTTYYYFRMRTRARLGAAQLGLGKINDAYLTAQESKHEISSNVLRHRIQVSHTMSLLYWVLSDFVKLENEAKFILQQCSTVPQRGILESWAFAHNHLGYIYYLKNDLERAQWHFAVVAERQYQIGSLSYAESVRGLIYVYQATGYADKAEELFNELVLYQLESGMPRDHQDVSVFQAEMYLFNNRSDKALTVLDDANLQSFRILEHLRYFVPHLSAVKVYVAQSDSVSRAKARELLQAILEFEERLQNFHFLSKALALKAILEASENNQTVALDLLGKSIHIAKDRQCVRCLIDVGPGLYSLLIRYRKEREHSEFIDTLIAISKKSTQANSATGKATDFMPDLTNRELDVLELLNQRLSNKEIAKQLVIAVPTVKRHILNIFGKLNVNRRQDAVARARQLGLLD